MSIKFINKKGGINISDATATAGDILAPKVAYGAEGKIEGTMIPTYAPGGDTILSSKTYYSQLAFDDINFEYNIAIRVTESELLIYKAKNDAFTDTEIVNQIPFSAFGIDTVSKFVTFKDSTQFGYKVVDGKIKIYTVLYGESVAYAGCCDYNVQDSTISNYLTCDATFLRTNKYVPDVSNLQIIPFPSTCAGNRIMMFARYFPRDGLYHSIKLYELNFDMTSTVAIYDKEFISMPRGCDTAILHKVQWSPNGLYFIASGVYGNKATVHFVSIIKFEPSYDVYTNLLTEFVNVGNYNAKGAFFISDDKIIRGADVYSLSDLNTKLFTTSSALGNLPSICMNKTLFVQKLDEQILEMYDIQNDDLVLIDSKTTMTNNTIFHYDNTNRNLTYQTSEYNIRNYVKSLEIGDLIQLRAKGTTLYNTSDSTLATTDKTLTGVKYYNSEGLKTGTMPNNGALNYIPTTEAQTIPEGYTSGGTVSAVDSSIDSNLIAENIKVGITILGVIGTYTGETTE